MAAGLVEGGLQGAPPLAAVCAAGAAAMVVGPLGFLLSLAARGLWRAWRPVLAPGADAARLLGGAVYAVLAVAALAAVGFGTTPVAMAGSSAGPSPPLVASVLAAAAAVLLIASRPAALALAWAARRLGLRQPRGCLAAGAGLAGGLAAGVWFGVVGPSLAGIDYDYAGYGWTAVVGLPVAHAIGRRMHWRRLRLAAGGAAALAWLGLVASTVSVRLAEPATLFDAWYRMPIGGLAIGLIYDIDELRSQSMPADLAPRPRPGAAHPDVLLVTIDTVRADQLRLYGGAAGMPNLEALARRGRVFDWAIAPSNNTRQSVSAMMTGLSPARLRGRVVEFGLKLDPRHIVLAERFRAAGYATAGFLCCPLHMGGRKKIGLDRGLESVEYRRDGGRLEDLASRWLRASAGEPRPRFVWIHFFEPHDWTRLSPPGSVAADPGSSYRRVVERADTFLGPILEAAAGSGRPAFLVVTSDHGEGLGDHRAMHHSSNLYNSQTRVPLVVAGPGLGPPGRIAQPVGLLDLAPTLLDLAGFEPPGMPDMDARSFADLVRGESRAGIAEAYAVMVRDRSVARSGRALVAGRFKLVAIDGRRLELYDLGADPAEARNLAAKKPELTTDLAARLARRRAVDTVPPF